ncbi:hypothetical protein KBY86_03275 [Synechococcus sp. Lug-A]|uniref:hypothetical protein n=1 Tax=Synechococcus sp. Lug-A TaxID=2823740 RepID=UPI0020CD600B|nr:hypothetical protein [Synechococcus sp. Lug-A]MCP9845917.1 hypothetical protein [Synechococcus sp. Lug-A]
MGPLSQRQINGLHSGWALDQLELIQEESRQQQLDQEEFSQITFFEIVTGRSRSIGICRFWINSIKINEVKINTIKIDAIKVDVISFNHSIVRLLALNHSRAKLIMFGLS